MMLSPYKGAFRVSQPYTHGIHNGLDMVGMDSKELFAVCRGYIGSSARITDKSNKTWEWGNYVKLVAENDDIVPNGTLIYYCHMSERLVSRGERVERGSPIGIEGNTGFSFGSHLHLEVRDKSNKSTTKTNVITITRLPNVRGSYSSIKEDILLSKEYDELKALISDLSLQIKALKATVDKQGSAIGKLGTVYNSIGDVPQWAREEIAALVNDKIIIGDGSGKLNLSPAEIRILYLLRSRRLL